MFYLVSGGPGGSLDYITLKGYRLLKKADVVFYHSLFDATALLGVCKRSCDRISVRTMSMDRRIAVIGGNPKKLFVELFSGDVAWFSMAQKMMDALESKGISYEIVPGVSSVNMAAALLGRELTLPGISQCCIVSCLAGSSVIDAQSIGKLASHNATLVVLMVHPSRLSDLKGQLLAGGVSKDTPVAVLYKVSYPDQKILRLTVDGIDGLEGDLWHSVFIVGWVLADGDVRRRVSGLPFVSNFALAEDYVQGGVETVVGTAGKTAVSVK